MRKMIFDHKHINIENNSFRLKKGQYYELLYLPNLTNLNLQAPNLNPAGPTLPYPNPAGPLDLLLPCRVTLTLRGYEEKSRHQKENKTRQN